MSTEVVVTVIRKCDGPYLTVQETIRANAERHRRNGEQHLAGGKPEFAAGSFRKMERNLKRAAMFDLF